MMDTSKLRLKDMWITIPAFLLLASFIVWPDFGRTMVRLYLIVILGLVLLVGFIWAAAYIVHRVRRNRHPRLRDGSDISVSTTDSAMVVTDMTTNELTHVPWNQVESVSVVAVDDFPVGRISYLITCNTVTVEVPWDALGNAQMLAGMQDALSGFDNNEVIRASSMLNGSCLLWKRAATDAYLPIPDTAETPSNPLST